VAPTSSRRDVAGQNRCERLPGLGQDRPPLPQANRAAVRLNPTALVPPEAAISDSSSPREPALRKARVCYDHLAGDLGVLVFDSLDRRRWLRSGGATLELTSDGRRFCREFGIDVDALARGRRPLCRACLDWSVRRHHLAGAVGAAVLGRCLALGWARRAKGSRVVMFSDSGERALRARFSMPDEGSIGRPNRQRKPA
jgi:hypothetical protein